MNRFCGKKLNASERLELSKVSAPKCKCALETNSHGPLGTDTRETAETYRGELFRFGHYRVAVCRDGLQWLYQRKRAVISPRGVAWNTVGYCVSRNALVRLHRAYNGADAPKISTLPFHFNKEAQND